MRRVAAYIVLVSLCGFGLTGCLAAAAGAGAVGGAAVAEETKPKPNVVIVQPDNHSTTPTE